MRLTGAQQLNLLCGAYVFVCMTITGRMVTDTQPLLVEIIAYTSLLSMHTLRVAFHQMRSVNHAHQEQVDGSLRPT
jgi:hypothetical protein